MLDSLLGLWSCWGLLWHVYWVNIFNASRNDVGRLLWWCYVYGLESMWIWCTWTEPKLDWCYLNTVICKHTVMLLSLGWFRPGSGLLCHAGRVNMLSCKHTITVNKPTVICHDWDGIAPMLAASGGFWRGFGSLWLICVGIGSVLAASNGFWLIMSFRLQAYFRW